MRGKNKSNVIMIADDDLFVRKVLRTAIQDLSSVVEAKDGSEVSKIYTDNMPDMIFLDIHLPNVSGLDLIPKILAADDKAHIIMLSADSSQDNVQVALKRGAKGFLTKPFELRRVLQIMQTCPTVVFSD